MINDLLYALRVLVRNPGFTLTVVLTLGLGIGVTTTVFGVVDKVLFISLPLVEEPERLAWFFEENGRVDVDRDTVSTGNYADWKREVRSFSSLAALKLCELNVVSEGEPERLSGVVASSEFFTATGTRPALGRVFLPEDDQPGATPVVLLSHRYWSRRLASRPDVVGTKVLLDGTPRTIAGVLPEDFAFPRPVDVYVPLVLEGNARTERRQREVAVLGRLRPAVSLSAAQEEMKSLAARIAETYPDTNKGWSVTLVPVQELFVGPRKIAGAALMIAVSLVLLITCANVGNVLLARAWSRRREIATRAAMGADRRQLLTQLLIESCVLSALGAGLGLVLARWGVDLVIGMIPPDIALQLGGIAQVTVDGRCLLFTMAVAVVAVVLFGLVPALRASRPDTTQVFQDAGPTSSASRFTRRLNSVLVAAQVVFAVVLVASAAWTAEILVRSMRVPLGFEAENLLTAHLHLTENRYSDDDARSRFQQELERQLSALPGVRGAALADGRPLQRQYNEAEFNLEGEPIPEAAARPRAKRFLVSENYFATLQIPVLRGRDFDGRDRADGPPVAILSQNLASRYFPEANPLGRRLSVVGDKTRTIVAVVGDVHDSFRHNSGFLYVPLQQAPPQEFALFVRASGSPLELIEPVRDQLHRLDPREPVTGFRTGIQLRDETLLPRRLLTRLFAILGVAALLLAAVGIYGVVAFTVGQRKHELAIRSALGASPWALTWLVMRGSLGIVCVGLGVGLVLSLLTTRAISEALGGPPGVFLTGWVWAAGVMVGVSVVASWVPARRAVAR